MKNKMALDTTTQQTFRSTNGDVFHAYVTGETTHYVWVFFGAGPEAETVRIPKRELVFAGSKDAYKSWLSSPAGHAETERLDQAAFGAMRGAK